MEVSPLLIPVTINISEARAIYPLYMSAIYTILEDARTFIEGIGYIVIAVTMAIIVVRNT